MQACYENALQGLRIYVFGLDIKNKNRLINRKKERKEKKSTEKNNEESINLRRLNIKLNKWNKRKKEKWK